MGFGLGGGGGGAAGVRGATAEINNIYLYIHIYQLPPNIKSNIHLLYLRYKEH